MIEAYFCSNCKVHTVFPKKGKFNHPDLGESTCLVCRKCGTMVYLREIKGDEV